MFEILKFDELYSTNKYALENINDISENTVIRAEIQTAGRGRFDRKWISDTKNNCYISFVLKPDIKYRNNFPNLTQYLSVILCNELKKYNLIPTIKWPNDVQINGKKISGILSEVSFLRNEFQGIVLGIGVNLNFTEETLNKIGIPATSLNLEINKNADADFFINSLVTSFFERYEQMLAEGFVSFKNEYLVFANFLQKEVKIKNPDIKTLGIAMAVNDDGSLTILTKSGEEKTLFSGDLIV